MVVTRQRLVALGASAVGTTLLVAVIMQGSGGKWDRSLELLSGADAEAARQVQRRGAALHSSVGEGGSQLADLIDSPLMLAKQKIDNYLNEDSDDLVESARKMNVVGSKDGGAPCTSLKCDSGVWQNDYLQTSKDRLEKVLNGEDPGKKLLTKKDQQQYMDAEEEFAGAADMDANTMQKPEAPADMNALTIALTKKLATLKQHFREVRAQFDNGPSKDIRINVKPRGPRGTPGVKGDIGPQGWRGSVGSTGPPGHKGVPGPMGGPGKRGRKGKTGPAGSIGKPGGMGGKGRVGNTGPRGFTGALGSRGLPGAAGAPGTNGKDGPPGPPGRNSPWGPPGPNGMGGDKGPAGKSGNNGPNGGNGLVGRTGTTGEPGRQGRTGTAGHDGVGPAPAVPMKKKGEWPKGNCYNRADPCAALGVTDNLCGKCEPLCKRCGAKSGFQLLNPSGLRFKGYSFDDQNLEAGSNQVRNICMLARYGNEGKFKGKTASLISAKSWAESTSDDDLKQPHWYGNCAADDKDKAQCCSNAQLVKSGFNWYSYGTGDDCLGNLDTDRVTVRISCIFDEADMKEQDKPILPRDGDIKGGGLVSVGEMYQTSYRSLNGKCDFILADDGAMLINKNKKTIWQKAFSGKASSPYSMTMAKSGSLQIYNGAHASVFSSETQGSDATQVRLTNQCCLTVMNEKKQCKWSSCGCPAPSIDPAKKDEEPSPPDTPEPDANTLYNGQGKSILNIRCANFRDSAQTWASTKQIEYYSKCMAQDCVQSLESGDSNPGCRFLDTNGFCYAYGSAQTWCADHLTYAGCNDGGTRWGTPPIGTAVSPGQTEWTPQQGAKIRGSGSEAGQLMGCQCMKNCACTKETCRCADMETRPMPAMKGISYPYYKFVFGDHGKDIHSSAAKKIKFNAQKWKGSAKGEWIVKKGKGKLLLKSGKKGECSCRCGIVGDGYRIFVTG